jgi:hypothetical protein
MNILQYSYMQEVIDSLCSWGWLKTYNKQDSIKYVCDIEAQTYLIYKKDIESQSYIIYVNEVNNIYYK